MGITAAITDALVTAGVGADTAGIIAPALLGAGTGAGLSGLTGGNIGKGALEGGITGGLGGGLGEIADAGGGGLSGFGNSVGGIFGDSTLGSDIGSGLSNFIPSSGLSSLLGGTAQPTNDLTNIASDLGNVSTPDVAAQATSPSNFASGGDYGAGGSPVPGAATGPGAITATAGGGGGAIGGGAVAPAGQAIGEDVGNIGSAVSGAGIGAPPASQNMFSNLFSPSNNAGTFNYDINGAPAGASSFSPTEQFANAASPASNTSGLSSLAGGSKMSPINGLINSGLGMLLNNPNQKGANQITGATNAANANYQPYLQQGTAAENTLGNLYGNNGAAAQTSAMNNFQTQPGYQFALNQGLNAVNANAAAMGNPLSGNNEQAINNYAQGTASQQYNNYINQLQNMASGGMTAAGGIGSNLLTGAGAQSAASGNKAQAQNTAVGTGLNALFPTGGFNLQQLLSGGNTGGGGAGLLGMLGLS